MPKGFTNGHPVNLGNQNVLGKHWKLSKETREKQRKAQSGRKHPWSEESKKRQSENCKKFYRDYPEKILKKEKNGNWKGGIKFTEKSRLDTLKRDNYICQECGFSEKEIMQVDHILSRKKYPLLKNDLNNLITLCPNCHWRKTLKELKNINKKCPL